MCETPLRSVAFRQISHNLNDIILQNWILYIEWMEEKKRSGFLCISWSVEPFYMQNWIS